MNIRLFGGRNSFSIMEKPISRKIDYCVLRNLLN